MPTALRSNESPCDAFGILSGASDEDLTHLRVVVKTWKWNHTHAGPGDDTPTDDALVAAANVADPVHDDWAAYEVEYDAGDVQGTFRVPGCSGGVIGLWLATYTLGTQVGSVSGGSEMLDITPTDYTVTEAAGNAAYMYRRGLVWPPGELGEQSYP